MLFYLYRTHIAVAVAGVLALGALLAFANNDEQPASRTPWVLVDLSGSTRQARARYSEEFRRLATAQSQVPAGEIALLAIKGDPAGESDIRTLPLGVTTNNPSSADIDRRLNVLQAADELDALLRKPPQRVAGSALVEGLWLLAGRVGPGDTIYVYSDGLQDSRLMQLYVRRRELASEPQIERIVDELEARRYIADMHGVSVKFVLPGFRGGAASITDPSQVKAFWEAWARRTHARLDYG
jgi:hypothetical protein